MRRTRLLAVLCVTAALIAAGAAGAVAQEEPTTDETSPGEQLSGVVGVGEAEFDGELDDNAFEIALQRADGNATRASEIASRVNDTETRLAELEERRDRLETRRANGEITQGEYRARMARIVTESDNAQRQLNRSEAAAAEIPDDVLEANGVNVSAIETLRQNASDLSGPEVSEIARSIAGPNRGSLPEPASGPADRGPDNATTGADDRPETENETVSDRRPGGVENGTEADGSETAGSDGRDGTAASEDAEGDTDESDTTDAGDGGGSAGETGGSEGGTDDGGYGGR